MNEFFDNVSEKGKVFVDAAVQTAGELFEKGTVLVQKGLDKAEELRLNNRLRNVFAEIGAAVYESKSVEGLEDLFNQVDDIKAAIAAIYVKDEEAEETAEEVVEEAAEEAAAETETTEQ